MKILLTLIAFTVSMSAFAQGRGGEGGQGRGQGGGLQEDRILDKDLPLNPDACSLESDKRISSELISVSFLSLSFISRLISC